MDNEMTLDFIEDYRSHSCLWDVTNISYTKKNKRSDAYLELATKYNMTEKSVRNKIKSLRSYFSKEHKKNITMKSGSGGDDDDSPWFAYKALLFIADSRLAQDSYSIDSTATESHVKTESPNDNEEKYNPDEHNCNPQESGITISSNGQIIHEDALSTHSESIRTERKLKRKRGEDSFLKFLSSTASLTAQDDCSVFGQLVGIELKKLNPRSKEIAKNHIQNYLFKLQMEELENQQSTKHRGSPIQ